MQTKTKPAPTFLRTSFTQTLIFPGRPSREIRLALRAAGWRWNPAGHWWKNEGQTLPIKSRDLASLLTPVTADTQPDPVTA